MLLSLIVVLIGWFIIFSHKWHDVRLKYAAMCTCVLSLVIWIALHF
jgi:hypothetical protein